MTHAIRRFRRHARRLLTRNAGYTPLEYALLCWGLAVAVAATAFAMLGDLASAFARAMAFG